MTRTIIEDLKDVLTIKKLSHEIALTEKQRQAITHITDEYLESLLGGPKSDE